MVDTKKIMKQKQIKLNCRPETRELLNLLAEKMGWTYTEAIHRCIKSVAEREGIRLPNIEDAQSVATDVA